MDPWLHRRARELGLEVFHLDDLELPLALLARVPARLARAFRVIPVRLEYEQDTLVLATDVVDGFPELSVIAIQLGSAKVRLALASTSCIDGALACYYSANS